MPPRRRLFVRAHAVTRAQHMLEERSFPRLQMTLIAMLTGAFGLLSSFVLLHQGIERMALRYPLSLVLAYGMFLFLIWLWLRTNADDYVDFADLPNALPSDVGGAADMPLGSAGGGDLGGGGASASFDSPIDSGATDVVGGVGKSLGSVADADELAIPLLAIVLAVGLALASFYVIYIAPSLLAEVLVDGALSYVLYRHIRGKDPAHWLATAVRRTILPFAATAVFLAIMGAAMAAYAPGARSLGEVVRHASTTK